MNRIFVVLIGMSIPLRSGVAAAQELQGGVHGGVAFSTLSNLRNAIDFGGPVDINRRTGFVIGPFVAFPMNATVALQVEALFATKGATPTDGTNELRIRLSYVDLPVLLRLTPFRTQRFFFLFGPSLNFNISAKTIDVIPTGAEEDIKDDIRTTEFGVVFGAGVALRRVLVQGRYSVGLTDIVDAPVTAPVPVTAPIRNRAFTILAGIGF